MMNVDTHSGQLALWYCFRPNLLWVICVKINKYLINDFGTVHARSVIHGDLTSANVLINDNRVACLVDFGMSSIKAELEGSSYWPSTIGGAIRWRAPELLAHNDHVPILSSASDIYSFGSVMLHVREAAALVLPLFSYNRYSFIQTLSGRVPYFNFKSETSVFLQVLQGIRPHRPSTSMLTDGYWSFITQCWNDIPHRPHIDEVHRALIAFRQRLQAPSNVS